MPIFEYRCALCGHRKELLQRSFESSAPVCPHCTSMRGGKTRVTSVMVRVISKASFSLKGSGWFRDGYGLQESSSSSSEKDQ
jgi:putative FmdB family regulatory protein